ncbi:MAG: cation diffusion facilitator family transporter [Candidatus Kapaibacterium sp.]|nr:cation diffusion facilitator family transporter [Bacteroidota bacterium]
MKSALSLFFDVNSPRLSAVVSMVACIILALSGIALGFLEDSLAIRTNGLVAAIDVINSIILVAAINRSIRTPDYIFNYGYGKYESLGLLLSALLLLITFAFTAYQAVVDLYFGVIIKNYTLLIIFSVLSFVFMRFISVLQSRRAKRFKMPMLEYDADMWKTDSIIELIVLIGLCAGWAFMHWKYKNTARFIDGVSALVLLLVAMRVPLKHGKEAINQLLDKTLPDEIQFDILAVVAENISSFCEFKSVHTRQSGKDIFVEIDVVMPFDFTFEQAYPMEKVMKEAIQQKYPTAITRIYAVPCPRDCIRNGVSYCPVKQALANQQNA